MAELYQDPDPISSNRTPAHTRKISKGELEKLFRNPFARTKSRTKTTETTADHTVTFYSNPFTTISATTTADDVTLVNQDISYDLDANFRHAEEKWKVKLKNHRVSGPASEVGEHPSATSVDSGTILPS